MYCSHTDFYFRIYQFTSVLNPLSVCFSPRYVFLYESMTVIILSNVLILYLQDIQSLFFHCFATYTQCLKQDMGEENQTMVAEFIFTGSSNQLITRIILTGFFFLAYLVTLLGNGLIILLTICDPHLHTPMYFFLNNLSLLDICYSSSIIPQALVNFSVERPTISFARCFCQMLISLFLGSTECFLLAVMAYDRYVAISNPLRYTVIMSKTRCIHLALASWIVTILLTVVPFFVMPSQFCGKNELDHFTCEVLAVMKLVCSDTSKNQIFMFASASLTLFAPFFFILFSYMRIIMTILKIHSLDGRSKAFSTCGSHLTVVTIFYGTAMFMYLKPQSKSSQEQDKIITVFYGIVTPMLNPLIYTLRNQEVKAALQRVTGRKRNT
ncbi:olfactory receptor 13H1-like [Alligator sinensis]|uniref:Olfactory receptor n=1 Tax=Alligator sinensis TaxID=38654 RepID=A0A1U7SPK1_ALLSI|nr:olfactory receptor 13H1-like [Alligator sinensis]